MNDPEVTARGIRVALSEDEWIEFVKEPWSMDEEFLFQKSSDFEAFRLIVTKTLDWKVKDVNQALIPFDQEKILDQMEKLESGIKVQMPRIPVQMQIPLATAFYTALREARRLPPPLLGSAG